MFNFFRRDTKVIIQVDNSKIDMPKGLYNFSFDFGKNNEVGAELFMRHLKERFYHLVGDIRAQAYNQGYKDAKAKTKKKSTFLQHFSIKKYIGF